MTKILYMLIALSGSGDEFIIDSQLSASDCIAAIAANSEPFKMDIGGISVYVETLSCEVE